MLLWRKHVPTFNTNRILLLRIEKETLFLTNTLNQLSDALQLLRHFIPYILNWRQVEHNAVNQDFPHPVFTLYIFLAIRQKEKLVLYNFNRLVVGTNRRKFMSWYIQYIQYRIVPPTCTDIGCTTCTDIGCTTCTDIHYKCCVNLDMLSGTFIIFLLWFGTHANTSCVKVKFTLWQAMKAQRSSRFLALLFL